MLPRVALIFPLSEPVAAQNKRRSQSRVSRELNVTISIADHPARTPIDLKLLRRAIDQSRLRLATIAIDPVRRVSDSRMVRAVVNRIETCVFQLGFQLLVNLD